MYLFLAQDPWHPVFMAKAHGAEDRDGDSKAASPKLLVLCFGVFERICQALWDVCHFVVIAGFLVVRNVSSKGCFNGWN